MCKQQEHPVNHHRLDGWPTLVQRIHDCRDGHVDVAATVPYRYDSYETDKPPILIANGFGSGIKVMGRLARHLAERHDRIVWTYDDQRVPAARQDPLSFRADTVRSVIDHFDGVSGYDEPCRPSVVAWSTGAPATLNMARGMVERGETDRLGSILAVGPAGFIGPDTRTELLARASQEVLRATKEGYVMQRLGALATKMGLGYVGRDIPLALRELSELSRTDVCRDVAQLRDAGVSIGVLAFEQDKIFPLNRIESSITTAGINDVFAITKGTHVDLAWQPEAAADLEARLQALEGSVLENVA